MEAIYYSDFTNWFLACCSRIDVAAWKKTGCNGNDDWVIYSDKANIFFASLFMPRCKTKNDFWFGDPCSKKAAERRMLALYLAAHMAYSEGL